MLRLKNKNHPCRMTNARQIMFTSIKINEVNHGMSSGSICLFWTKIAFLKKKENIAIYIKIESCVELGRRLD